MRFLAMHVRMLTLYQAARPSCAEIADVLEREVAWAAWDPATRAAEVRALAPREVERMVALDEEARVSRP